MDPIQTVQSKRKLLVESLVACLQRSEVCAVVPIDILRTVFESASSELWREGEFRLEMVWQILCQQPGLDARKVAPPLLLFKSFEDLLGVTVIQPHALSAIPRGEQERLRQLVQMTREEFTKSLDALNAREGIRIESPAVKNTLGDVVAQAAAAESPPNVRQDGPPGAGEQRSALRSRRKLAGGLSAVAIVALGVGLYVTFGARPTAFDTSDVRSIVQLEEAVTQGHSLLARIADPKWNTLSKEEQRRAATLLLEAEGKKGIQAITLRDPANHLRAIATAGPGTQQQVLVLP